MHKNFEDDEDIPNSSSKHAGQSVPSLNQTPGEIDGVHPALENYYKKIKVVNIVHVAVFTMLLILCLRQPTQLIFLIPLGAVYIWSAVSRVKRRRKLRELGSILARDSFVSTTIELKLEQALGVFKKYSGKLMQETRFTSPQQPVNIKEPSGSSADAFHAPEAIPANLYVDPESQKVLAINTPKGLLLVDNDFGAGMNPWAQVALVTGITAVTLPVGIVVGFLFAAGGLRSELPEKVPAGLTAKRYYELGKRYKDAGWTELSRESLNKAIEMDKGEVGKKAEMYRRAKLPHTPVPEDAITQNILAFNEAAFNRAGAEKHWKECIEKYPDFEWPYSNLASQYLQDKRFDEADKLLTKALELNPYYTNALVRMAFLKDAQHKKDEALKYVTLALEYEPDNTEAAKLKESLTEDSQ